MKQLLFIMLLLPISVFAQTNITRSEGEAKETINRLYERLTNGEDFSFLAKMYSDDIGSRQSGGMIGYMRPNELVKEYAKVVTKTKVGEISEPFKTQFGYHILQVIGKRGKEYNTRHILIKYE